MPHNTYTHTHIQHTCTNTHIGTVCVCMYTLLAYAYNSSQAIQINFYRPYMLHILTHTQMPIHIYKQTNIHTNTHTHTHTHMYACTYRHLDKTQP